MDIGTLHFLSHAEDSDGNVYVLVPYVWVEWVNVHVNEFITRNAPPPSLDEQLQQAADYMRANAAERFPELTFGPLTERWYDSDSDPVVFTPYGYRKEKEVQDELHG